MKNIKQYLKNKFFAFNPYRSSYPEHVLIEPTNICNLRCPLCVTGSGVSKRKKTALSFSAFKQIVDEIKGKTRLMTVSGYGEPFLNMELLKMFSYASKANMKVYVNTNAHFVSSLEQAKEIVKTGVYNLQIGLDAVDQKTYEKYRWGGDFSKVIASIKYLVQAKKELKSKTPVIVLLYLLMKHNEKDLKKARELSKELGADFFHEKPICLNDFKDEGFLGLVNRYLPKDEDMRRYKNIISEINFSGDIANNCPRIYRSIVINSVGDVLPCVCDQKNCYVLGNVFKNSVRSVWNGKKFREFRRKVLTDQKNIDICRTCSFARKEKININFFKTNKQTTKSIS